MQEIIDKQSQHSLERNQAAVGNTHRVLIEGVSKRSEDHLFGRNDQNKVVIFPRGKYQKGEYVNVLVDRCTQGTLFGEVVG